MEIDINSKFKQLIPSKRFKFIYGGRSSGKSYGIADIIILMVIGFIPFGLNAQELIQYSEGNLDYKVKPLTVLCAREIQNSIKDSVLTLLSNRIKALFPDNYDKLFNVTDTEIRCHNGGKFLFRGLYRNADKLQSIPDINICWVEEAQSISQKSMSILVPTVRENNSELWFTYNPNYDNDAVIVLKNSADPKHKVEVNINWQDNPFFSEASRIQKDTDYRVDPDLAVHTWEGHTLQQGHDYIIKLNAVTESIDRKITTNNTIEIGADLARYGNDLTVIFKRKGLEVIDYKEISKSDTVYIENEIKRIADYNKSILIKIDEGNIGGGVIDHLKKEGYNVVGVNNGAAANNKEKYANCITEQWFNMRDIIDTISIPNIPRLKQELSSRKYGYTSGNKLIVEKKEDYKKRVGKSPDYADALLLCFYKANTKNYRIRFI